MAMIVKSGGELARNVLAVANAKCGFGADEVRYTVHSEPGLILAVSKTGAKVWRMRYSIGAGADRKQRTAQLGTLQAVPFPEACKARQAIVDDLAAGLDPERKKEGPLTFDALFRKWVEVYGKKRLRTWQGRVDLYELHVQKRLGDKEAAKITRRDVADLRDATHAQRIVTTTDGRGRTWQGKKGGAGTSNQVVALYSSVANWGVNEGLLEMNHAIGLNRLSQPTRRERVLSGEEVTALWLDLAAPRRLKKDGTPIPTRDIRDSHMLALALRFMLATGCRSTEALGLREGEIGDASLLKDGALPEGSKVWTLPDARSKNKLAHVLPLCPMAMALIAEAVALKAGHPLTCGSKLVFPSSRTGKAFGKDAAGNRMERVMSGLGLAAASPHCLRKTVGTQMSRLGVALEVRAYILNHVDGARSKVTSFNYDISEHLPEKRAGLLRWEGELGRLVSTGSSIGGEGAGNVVRLREVVAA